MKQRFNFPTNVPQRYLFFTDGIPKTSGFPKNHGAWKLSCLMLNNKASSCHSQSSANRWDFLTLSEKDSWAWVEGHLRMHCKKKTKKQKSQALLGWSQFRLSPVTLSEPGWISSCFLFYKYYCDSTRLWGDTTLPVAPVLLANQLYQQPEST